MKHFEVVSPAQGGASGMKFLEHLLGTVGDRDEPQSGFDDGGEIVTSLLLVVILLATTWQSQRGGGEGLGCCRIHFIAYVYVKVAT